MTTTIPKNKRELAEAKNTVAAAQFISGEQITAIQHSMNLSDLQFLEAIGYEITSNNQKHMRAWKAGENTPSGTARIAIKLLYAIDRANKLIDTGEWDRAHRVLQDAVPDFMQ
jgi:DNA-binding transcriptional regulator YiaG